MPHLDLPPRETEAAGRPGASRSHAIQPIPDVQGRVGWELVAEKFLPCPSVPTSVVNLVGKESGLRSCFAPNQASTKPSLTALFLSPLPSSWLSHHLVRELLLGLFSPLSQAAGGSLGSGVTWEFCSTLAMAAGLLGGAGRPCPGSANRPCTSWATPGHREGGPDRDQKAATSQPGRCLRPQLG